MTFHQWIKIAAKKTWAYVKLARIELLVLFAFLVLDLGSKAIVEAVMVEDSFDRVVIIPGLIHFVYTINTAAAMGNDFGLGAFARPIFLTLTVPAVVGFCIAMFWWRGRHILPRICFAMMIAGTLGNFYDRLFVLNAYGEYGVRDFIQFNFSFFPFIFNVADIALVVGVGLFALYFLFLYKEPKPAEQAQAASDESSGVNAQADTDENPLQADDAKPSSQKEEANEPCQSEQPLQQTDGEADG